ncbi:MAG TPA: TetR/AcrR family transcriptional regulator [Ktedonobacteraceae bacterium]|nr:TetR/AcrR family transcriptional regulator [Ktedonobacteraceae bacterium]
MKVDKRDEQEQVQLAYRSVKEKVLAAAVRLFAEYGYHASTMRDIAKIAGIQAASIYYHYPSKQALLVEIMEFHMRQLNANLERFISKQHSVQQCLYAAVSNHILLHTKYKSEFFIIDTEIRALEGDNRKNILALRDHYEELIQELLREGTEQGVLRQTDVKIASYAIIAMCTEVAQWFKPTGRLSVQQVIEMYFKMITEGLLLIKDQVENQGVSMHI